MEPEYWVWLRENKPEWYEQLKGEIAWAMEWNRRAPDPRVAALVEAIKIAAAQAIATWGVNQALGVSQRSLAEVVMATIDDAALAALEKGGSW